MERSPGVVRSRTSCRIRRRGIGQSFQLPRMSRGTNSTPQVAAFDSQFGFPDLTQPHNNPRAVPRGTSLRRDVRPIAAAILDLNRPEPDVA